MDHKAFVQGYKAKELAVHLDSTTALKILDSGVMPRRYVAAHRFWSWIWFLSLPGFIALAIFFKWWVGLAGLFVVSPLIRSAVTRSACQFVIEHALEESSFFEACLERGFLSVSSNVRASAA
jgi:hypothetical protein